MLPTPPLPLESRVIERLFARLLLSYGAAFFAKWPGVKEEHLKADWARELAGVRLKAIEYALDYLPPDFPPTAMQFRAMCVRAPEELPPLLPAPPADPARVAALLKRAGEAQRARQPLQWAIDLKAREDAGERLTEPQRFAWRQALKTYEERKPQVAAVFTPIPNYMLPPGMRREMEGEQR